MSPERIIKKNTMVWPYDSDEGRGRATEPFKANCASKKRGGFWVCTAMEDTQLYFDGKERPLKEDTPFTY